MMDRIRRWGIGHPRRWWVCLSVLVVVTAACASPATQAPDSASTPTAAPTAMGKQAAADPTHTPMPTPNAIAERDSGSDPEPKSTPTPTPAASESPESDPEPTSTPTPTPTPAPPEEQMADPGPPATTTVAVTTTVVVPATPPLGDCFGGALSEHPLHCYVLKQAQAEGLIDVLAVYEGGDGRVLYVSINGELSGALYRFAEEKSYSFYDTWPELLPEEKYGVYGCDGTVRECYLELRYWHSNGGRFALLPPPRGGYKRLQVVPGEDAGRRSVRGWASWRQVWSSVAAQSGTVTRGAGESPMTGFDVSDVDVTNFPEMDCSRGPSAAGCRGWKKFPDVGYAGVHGWDGAVYIQVKNPPTDEAELKALKDRLRPCHDVIGECTYTHENGETRRLYTNTTTTVEIVPVKYDHRELWRWSTILNRFALSAGNTLNITSAYVGTNEPRLESILLTGEGQQVFGADYDCCDPSNPADIRETIVVFVYGGYQRVANELPVLLPQLGIPVDAVGMVRFSDEFPD